MSDVVGGRVPPSPRRYRTQRLLDLVVVVILTPFVGPVACLCAALVRVSSRGPVLFRQERVGLAGSSFEVLKFRTMVDGDNPLVPDPARITRVGRQLRRWSLDELPQLWNVARGDMSVVGPRPTVRSQVERYTPAQFGRLAVRPGLTGLAQVSGRNRLSWDRRIDLDLTYIERRSPLLDLRILVATFRAVMSGEGVEGHDAEDALLGAREEADTSAS